MNNLSSAPLFKTSSIQDGNMSFRIGDTENSLENRKQFLKRNNIDFQNHICMKCNHGEQITAIHRSTVPASIFGATTQEDMLLSEVLVTQEKGLALMLLTADCLPVSFYDPVTETIALAHFSRETISKLLPEKTVSFLRKESKVDTKNLLIQIGPHIHTDSYSFSLPQPKLSAAITPFTKETDTHVHVDLVAACTHQLLKSGIVKTNITTSPVDTVTSPNHFSHYQSRNQNTPQGRLATVLMLR